MRNLKSHLIRLTNQERLYQMDKPIIALTGGIATGKSTVTKILTKQGIQLIDADQLVKDIYQTQEAKDFIKNNFPDAWEHQEINFSKLRELFFKQSEVKASVEGFIYARLPDAFKAACAQVKNQNFYVYDVPLLFEKSLQQKVDVTIVVYAPLKVQMARLMDRDGHLEDMARKILSHQMDIEEKKILADFTVDNSGTLVELEAEVGQLLLQLF